MGSLNKAMIRSGISFDKSPNEYQLEFGGVAALIKPQKHLSPLSINAHPRMAGLEHHDFDCIQRIKESEASVDSRESLDEVEAHFSIYGSCTSELFGTPQTGGNALDTLTTDYLKEDPEPEDCAPDEDGNECYAAESDEEIVDEILRQSPMKNSTRSKSRKVVVPEPLHVL